MATAVITSKAGTSRWNWYWHRFRAMDAAELAGRVSQKLRHKLEGKAKPPEDFKLGEARPSHGHSLPARADAPEALRLELAREAPQLLAGHWRLFGWREVEVGTPPQWHRDPVSGGNTAGLSKLNHRNLPDGADARTLWETNRWCEMVRLAMHAWLNGDLASLETAQAWLENWVQSNPLGHGIHWSSPLEAGLRLMNFTWFDVLAEVAIGEWAKDERAQVLMKRQQALAQSIVPVHAWWLHRRLSLGSSANNHLLGELAGLLVAQSRWPTLQSLGASPQRLQQAVEQCVLTQFAEDGGNKEQALHYHLFAWEMILHVSRATQLSEKALARWRQAGLFLARMAQPQEPWDYGDSDDAQIVPLPLSHASSLREWCAWITHEPDGAVLRYWLGEAPAMSASAASPASLWHAPQSGMAVGRVAGWVARLDASPLGFGKIAAHGHCDALHVSLWDGDEALVIDPGTGGYFAATELRTELAAWAAHNGPQPVEGFRTPTRYGTFLLTQHHGTPQLRCAEGRMEAHFAHEGCELTRTVTFQDASVIIEDEERRGHPLRTRWYLAPECSIAAQSTPREFLVQRGSKQWRVQLTGDVTCEVQAGRASRAYGQASSCQVLEIHSRGPLRIVWTRV